MGRLGETEKRDGEGEVVRMYYVRKKPTFNNRVKSIIRTCFSTKSTKSRVHFILTKHTTLLAIF